MDYFVKDVVSTRADIWCLRCDEVVDCKYIGHLYIERWFRACIKVIELVNIKISLSIWNIKHYKTKSAMTCRTATPVPTVTPDFPKTLD